MKGKKQKKITDQLGLKKAIHPEILKSQEMLSKAMELDESRVEQFDMCARITMQKFDSLVKAGFTKEQAFKLVKKNHTW